MGGDAFRMDLFNLSQNFLVIINLFSWNVVINCKFANDLPLFL